MDSQSFSNSFEGGGWGTWGCEKIWEGVLYFCVFLHFYDPSFQSLFKGYRTWGAPLPPGPPVCIYAPKWSHKAASPYYQSFELVASELECENDGWNDQPADDEVEDDDQIPPDHDLVVRHLAKFRQIFRERFWQQMRQKTVRRHFFDSRKQEN